MMMRAHQEAQAYVPTCIEAVQHPSGHLVPTLWRVLDAFNNDSDLGLAFVVEQKVLCGESAFETGSFPI